MQENIIGVSRKDGGTALDSPLLISCIVSLFLSFTLFLYGPVGLYLSNSEEFWFTLNDVWKVVIPSFVIVFAVFALVGILLTGKARDIYLRLLFGITLGLYIQGTYINISYGNGVLDGGNIHWEWYTKYAVVNTAVWVLCIALPFLIKRIHKVKSGLIILALSLYCILMQLPAFIIQVAGYKPSQRTELSVTNDGIYDLGSGKNILVFGLDGMDEDYFRDFLEDHPEYATETLQGFVHYDNMLSSAARTIVGVPSLLTGIPYTRSDSYSDYLDEIWSGDNPLRVLDQNGYDVRAFSGSDFYDLDSTDYIKNFSRENQTVSSYPTLAGKLYKLTGFRFAPHLLKRVFWMSTDEFDQAKEAQDLYIEDDPLFYNNLLDNGGYQISDEYDNAYRFYMLKGAHRPYTTSADGLTKEKKTSRKEQVEGVFEIMKTILNDLREKGIYDDTMIVITADHGDVHVGEHLVFLLKDFGAGGEMTTTHVPGSMFDLAGLIGEVVGAELKPSEFSENLRELEEGQVRERHFFYNVTNKNKVAIKEYMTLSDADDQEAMTLVDTYQDTETGDTPYTLGTALEFTMDATANKYCTEGFGNTSGFLTRLMGPHAAMKIPIADLPETGELQVDFGVDKVYGNYDFAIKANGKTVYTATKKDGNRILKNGIHFRIDIPETFEDGDNILTISFDFDGIDESEMDLKVKNRTRTIGVTTLVIDKV